MRRTTTSGLAALGLGLSLGVAYTQAPADTARKGAAMSKHAKGTFEVKVTPDEGFKDTIASGRVAIAKTFQGDIVGTSTGAMWTADTPVKGSAGYVAIEKVSGSLGGREGTFTLLHRGTMRRGGDFDLTIVVVPDSGTGGLAGLGGTMAIRIADGKHSYDFEYTISGT
jgi:hypothetical protein